MLNHNKNCFLTDLGLKLWILLTIREFCTCSWQTAQLVLKDLTSWNSLYGPRVLYFLPKFDLLVTNHSYIPIVYL